MMQKIIKSEYITITDGQIPINLVEKQNKKVVYIIDIDGVEWLKTNNLGHACILFELLRDNVNKYMNYTLVK